jgi:hypothetical protein
MVDVATTRIPGQNVCPLRNMANGKGASVRGREFAMESVRFFAQLVGGSGRGLT